MRCRRWSTRERRGERCQRGGSTMERWVGRVRGVIIFFFSSRRRHTRLQGDWSSDVCSSDLGNAVARHIADKGGKVVILDVQEGPGRAAAAALGANASFMRCDVTSEAEVNAAMEGAHSRLAGLNLLVNCAGVVGAGRVLGKSGPMAGEFFTKVIHINLIGTFLCDKAAAALMQNNTPGPDGERGLLIHTSSVAAFEGQIGQAAYSATKAAVAGMTLPIARELARFGDRKSVV